MATEGKEKDGESLGTSTHPSMGKSPSTEGLTNTSLRDDTTSITRHEYNDGMSAIKAQMNEMTQLGLSCLRLPRGATPSSHPTLKHWEEESRSLNSVMMVGMATLSFPFMGMDRGSIPRLPLPRAITLYLFPNLILHMQDQLLSLTKMSILYGLTV